jgi:hypothetical protein
MTETLVMLVNTMARAVAMGVIRGTGNMYVAKILKQPLFLAPEVYFRD